MKKFSPTLLPYFAAFAASLQFAHSGYVYAGWSGAVIGGALGVTLSLSVAVAAARISDIARRRKPLAFAFGLFLLLLSPAAIAPASWVTFDILSGWVRVMAAVVWALIPDAAVVLSGAIAGGALVAKDAATSHEKPKQKQKQFSVSQAEHIYPDPYAAQEKSREQVCGLCGASYKSKGAHMRWMHPDKVHHAVYAVQVKG